MTIINNYTNLKAIYIGCEIDDRRGKKGRVVDIATVSVPWGIKYIFTLDNGFVITAID